MDGFTLQRKLQEALDESSSGSFMNERTSYDYLYDAIQDFNYRTHYQTSTQTISVVASTSSYDLNGDYVGMALMDSYNRPYIKHTYNGSDTFIFSRDYQDVVLENSSATASVAQSWSIVDATQPTNKTGTATSAGTATNGECVLTDTAADFTTVFPGDLVHNTTQSIHGVVIEQGAAHTVRVCLFTSAGASGGAWAQSDAYVIVPQPRYSIVLSPTPSATATLTVPYIQRPNPVYSSYKAYKLPFNYMLPIVQFAAFLYKYKDREPDYGDRFFTYYDGFARKVAAELRKGVPEKQGMRVNFRKLNSRSKQFGNWSR